MLTGHTEVNFTILTASCFGVFCFVVVLFLFYFLRRSPLRDKPSFIL